jgi:hypothetical protein
VCADGFGGHTPVRMVTSVVPSLFFASCHIEGLDFVTIHIVLIRTDPVCLNCRSLTKNSKLTKSSRGVDI